MNLLSRMKKSFKRGKYETDTLRAWYNLSLVFLIVVLCQGHLSCMGSFFVALRDTYDISREEAAQTLNFIIVGNLLSGILAGTLGHKMGFRSVLCSMLILSGTSLIASIFGTFALRLLWLKICCAINGITIGIIPPNLFQFLAFNFDRHRGKAFMIFMVTFGFNGLIYPSIVNTFLETFDLRGTFAMLGAFPIQAIVLVMLLKIQKEDKSLTQLEKSTYEDIDKPKQNNELVEEIESSSSELLSKIKRLLKSFTFYNLLIAQSSSTAIYFTVVTTIVDVGTDSQLNLPQATFLLTLYTIGDTVAKIITGFFVDKKILSYHLITAVGMILNAVGYLMIGFSSGIQLQVVVFLTGVFLGISTSTRLMIMPSLGLDLSATIYGLVTFTSGCLFLAVPKLIGKKTNSYKG